MYLVVWRSWAEVKLECHLQGKFPWKIGSEKSQIGHFVGIQVKLPVFSLPNCPVLFHPNLKNDYFFMSTVSPVFFSEVTVNKHNVNYLWILHNSLVIFYLFVRFASNLSTVFYLETSHVTKFLLIYRFNLKTMNLMNRSVDNGVVLFIKPYRINHFLRQYPYPSYRASINRFLFIDQNDKGHLSVSPGVCMGLGNWRTERSLYLIHNKRKAET